MQNRIYLTTTNLNEHHALAWQGSDAFASFELIRRLVTSHLSPIHGALFAQPLPDDVHRKADWYFLPPGSEAGTLPNQSDELGGQAARLVDLPPHLQNPIRAQLACMGQDIYNLSQTLKNSPDSNQRTAGVLLEMALTFPGEEFIYTVNNSPVLASWGFTSGSAAAGPEMLSRLRPVAAPVYAAAANTPTSSTNAAGTGVEPPTVQTEDRVHKFPLLWALLAFLVGALVLLFLLNFINPADFVPSGCTRAPLPVQNATEDRTLSDKLIQEQALEPALRAELERLRRELELRLAQCEPAPDITQIQGNSTPSPALDIPPEEEVPPVPELALPELPEFESAPEAVPYADAKQIPEQPTPPKQETNNLEIPEDPQDLSFLQGCWDAPTGLINVNNRLPIIIEYCFDASGKGRVKITELDKRGGKPMHNCEGSAIARMKGNRLEIDDHGAKCPDKNNYRGNHVTCFRDKNGDTVCSGRSKGKSRRKWGPVPFREIRK